MPLPENLPSVVGAPGPGEGSGRVWEGPAAKRVGGQREVGAPGGLPGEHVAHDGQGGGWPRSVVHRVCRAGARGCLIPRLQGIFTLPPLLSSPPAGAGGGALRPGRTPLLGTWPVPGSGTGLRPSRGASSGCAAEPGRCCGQRWPTPRSSAATRPPLRGAGWTVWTCATPCSSHRGRLGVHESRAHGVHDSVHCRQ